MVGVTRELHAAFTNALGSRVLFSSSVEVKPLDLDLALPLPARVRLYMYTLIGGVASRKREMKAVLRVPGQQEGEYASFDYGQDRLVILAAYRSDLDTFVLWDASLHPRFMYAGNVQVRRDTVLTAAAVGVAQQVRRLQSGVNETVYACRSDYLAATLIDRHLSTGGTPR